MQILFLRYGRQLLDSVRRQSRALTHVAAPWAHCCCSPLVWRHNPVVTLMQQLEEIFGTSDTNSGTRDLSLSEFLTSLNMSQAKQLRAKAAAGAVRAGAKPAAAGARASVAAPKRPPARS